MWQSVLALSTLVGPPGDHATGAVSLSEIGRLAPIGSGGSAEVIVHDADSQRLYVTDPVNAAVHAISMRDPSRPTRVGRIDLADIGSSVNSVAVSSGLIAVAVSARDAVDPGTVALYDHDLRPLGRVPVGATPDMVAFTPDGSTLLVANEGEPNEACTIDPPGSISLIDARAIERGGDPVGVRTISFWSPSAPDGRDLEPEYIAIDSDGSTAFVVCQENNQVAIIDLPSARLRSMVDLGAKDHSQAGQGLDASDRDGGIHIRPWPVAGLYQPDSIVVFEHEGRTLIATANEGDPRDYKGFSEIARVADVTLDADAFADWPDVQAPERLGRLRVTTTRGDTDRDGDFDELYSFGARSVSIWTERGELVWDSGDQIERAIAEGTPERFNSDHGGADENRSDDRGPEPEALAIARLDGRRYLLCGLERVSGIALFDITEPRAASMVGYIPPSDADAAPETMVAISAERSPTGRPLVAVAYEVSGTVVIYELAPAPAGDAPHEFDEIERKEGPAIAEPSDPAWPRD
ncbi:MAG: choice-of-anchor I family protein [Planctomycetota bacterium]